MSPLRRDSLRSFSFAIRAAKAREEQEALLRDQEEEEDPEPGEFFPIHGRTWTHNGPRAPNPHAHLPVYRTIHLIRKEVLACIGKSASPPAMGHVMSGSS